MIFEGKRPRKPRDFDTLGVSPAVWEIAERCWHEDPDKRPEAKAVLRDLGEIANRVSTFTQQI